MMTMLATMAMLIGAVLGQHCKVLILVPAIVIGSTIILAFSMAHNNNLWPTLLVMALTISALQIGYLIGSVIRFVIAGARVRREAPGTIAVAPRSAR
jgi:hypothetical protein